MSADIRCFNASEVTGLPPGWYVGAERAGIIVEATGPYPDQMTAAIKMTSKGGAVWLHGDGTTGNWTFDYKAGVFVSKAGNPLGTEANPTPYATAVAHADDELKTYRVQVCRVTRDVEYGWVRVTAKNEDFARTAALEQVLNDDGSYWCNGVKSEPIDSEDPYTDEVQLVPEGQS